MLCSHRDIYYNNTQLFGSQRSVDSIVEDISCLLKVPRRALHVVGVRLEFLVRPIFHLFLFFLMGLLFSPHQLATSKGLISGDLCYLEEDGTRVSCTSSRPVAVSSHIGGIRSIPGSVRTCPCSGRACLSLHSRPDIVSSAKFVLIVEKDATFQRLLDDGFCSKLSPCIMITVCFPVFGVRRRAKGFGLEFCSCSCLCASGERCARCEQQVDGEEALGHAPHPRLCAGGRRPAR